MALQSLLTAAGQHINLIAIWLGLASHLVFKSIEPSILSFLSWLATIIVSAFATSNLRLLQRPTSLRFLPTLQFTAIYLIALSTSIAVYRLFFNPLKKYPGSILAGVSKWHAFSLATDGQTHHYLQKQHRKHGDIIRVGPNEISVSDPAFLPIIHGAKSQFPKGPWYSQQLNEEEPGLFSIQDFHSHKLRRKVWDNALTPKALKLYEGRIAELLDIVEARFGEFADKNEKFDLVQWVEFLGFDVMGKIAFNLDFNSLKEGKKHFYVRYIHSVLEYLASLANISWVMPLVSLMPLDKQRRADTAEFMKFGDAQLQKRLESHGSAEMDAFGFLLKAGEKDQSHKLSMKTLAAETRVIIVGGSDTTTVAMSGAMYWLMRNPSAYKTLREECMSVFSSDEEFDASKLGDTKRAPYLNACVNESLRLLPPGPNGMQRVVDTPGGIFLGENNHVPEGTKISVHGWTLHHDPRNFERPWDFVPERWLEGAGFTGAHNVSAFVPFSLGSYGCIGRHLALMEVRMFLVRMTTKFDFHFAEGFDWKAYIDDTESYLTLTKEALPVYAKRSL